MNEGVLMSCIEGVDRNERRKQRGEWKHILAYTVLVTQDGV
jgi:hypothetical protein